MSYETPTLPFMSICRDCGERPAAEYRMSICRPCTDQLNRKIIDLIGPPPTDAELAARYPLPPLTDTTPSGESVER